MPTYERETRVNAPLEVVWEFHSRISGLKALTPAWMGLHIDSVTGPDGELNPTILEVGTEIRMSMQPLGIGPRQQFISAITEREATPGIASFQDLMIDGPFDHWVHTHTFYGDGEESVIHDHVTYELPYGRLGDTLEPFSIVGFEPMFRARHRKTRELLDGLTAP